MLLWVALAVALVSGVQSSDGETRISMVAVGDVVLNRSRVEVNPDGMDLWGHITPFSKMSKGIEGLVKADISFMNLETTVMDANDLPPEDKEYNFRTHPNAVRHLQKLGFNLMAYANNHAQDFGAEGIKRTRKWLKKLAKEHPLWFAGAGKDLDQASEPVVFTVKGVRIAFAAMANGKAAGKDRPGVASNHSPDVLLKKLRDTKADIRILSMHGGVEKSSKPDGTQLATARKAVDKYGIDLVLGHHPHVVQGVEQRRNGLIFYSLGNFMARGCRDMGSVKEFAGERDFGLLVKLKLRWNEGRKSLRIKEVEAVPVFDMHSGPHPFAKKADAKQRMDFLNRMSSALSDKPVEFVETDGRYIYKPVSK